jgi:hypothetical protein
LKWVGGSKKSLDDVPEDVKDYAESQRKQRSK